MSDIAPVAELIPHARGMCLLDAILQWDEESARSSATSHRSSTNPLRIDAKLPGICAIEYAAQTMAAHGALLARAQAGVEATAPMPGYIASVRDVQVSVASLERLDAPLDIAVFRLTGSERQVMYRFEIRCGEIDVATGRATVVLDTPLPA